MLRTGDLAKQAGVNTQTLRYYERRDLLPDPRKSSAGYRLYNSEAVRRIRFIKKAQYLGFTLDEVAELLSLQVESAESCDEVRENAERKVVEIDAKIRDLRAMKKTLSSLVQACHNREKTAHCPILDSLGNE